MSADQPSLQLVLGEGPKPCGLIFVGESPGENEQDQLRPFIPFAPTGKELGHNLTDFLGLMRHEVFLTNLHKLYLPNNRDPKPQEIAAHERYLLQELEEVQPRIIVPLGRFSLQWFLGQEKTVEQCEGFAFDYTHPLLRQKATVFPIRHPAAGLHQPHMAALVRMGFERLRLFLRGESDCRVPVDEYPGADYYYTDGIWPDDPFGAFHTALRSGVPKTVWVDTEWRADHSGWCVGVALAPGHGFVVRETATKTLKLLASYLARPDVTTVMHNGWGGDIQVLRQLGIRPAKIRDTMISSFICGLHPQGLKPLGYRLCGAEQEEYLEVTRGPGERMAREYLDRVLAMKEDCPMCQGRGRIPGAVPQKKELGKLTNDPARLLVLWELLKERGLLEKHGKTKACPKCKSLGWVSSWPPRDGDPVHTVAASLAKNSSDLRKSWDKTVIREMVEAELGPMPRADISHVYAEDPKRAIRYAGRDPDITSRVDAVLQRQIVRDGLVAPHDIDQEAMPLFEEMQSNGFLVDLDHFRALGDELGNEMVKYQQQANELAGREIGLGSAKQIAHQLYDRWGLKPIRMTAGGDQGSIEEKVLDAVLAKVMSDDPAKAFKGKMRVEPETVRDFILARGEFAECQKLKSTYCDKIQATVGRDGRLRDRFKLTRVPSGRAASELLLLIPVRSERGKRIREGFVAPEGMRLVSLDFSQIELRCAAHLSQDPRMLAVFREGRDLHDETNQAMFGGADRFLSKNLNFGIMYGLSEFGLQMQLLRGGVQKTDIECAAMIGAWFDTYSMVRRLMEEVIAFGRRMGYVEGWLKRRWYLANLRSPNKKCRLEAEREAFNYLIQEMAQSIMKLAMGKLRRETLPMLRASGCVIRPLLQLHDELIFEVGEGWVDGAAAVVREVMEGIVKLSVPVLAGVAAGGNWKELK